MKSTIFSLAAFAVQQAASHSTFQQLWVGSVDYQSTCARLPLSNSPIESLTSNFMRCNNNMGPAPAKCSVAAGGTVTIEMHAQPGDRSCANEAIGGKHYGPVIAYLSKVPDSSTADGSAGFFKIFEDGWSKVAGSAQGDDDNWGVKDLNKCCGRMNVKIPADIAPGDYLLRAEVIALHAATSSGGAQYYMTCYQLTVTGGGSASPPTVLFPGAYKQTDSGVGSIHGVLNSYVVPGPAVYAGGSTKSAGSGCTGVEQGTAPGTPRPTPTTSRGSSPTTTAGGGVGCQVPKYAQCGGNGYTGCTTCVAGSTCSAVSPPYYYQCT